MNVIQNLRTFKTGQFTVTINAVEDYDLDLTFDDDGEVLRQLERGMLVSFGVVATVTHPVLGELANDSLWGCVYTRPEEFLDHRECAAQTRKLRAEGSTAVCGSYFANMVKTVCEDARAKLLLLRSTANTIKVRK